LPVSAEGLVAVSSPPKEPAPNFEDERSEGDAARSLSICPDVAKIRAEIPRVTHQ